MNLKKKNNSIKITSIINGVIDVALAIFIIVVITLMSLIRSNVTSIIIYSWLLVLWYILIGVSCGISLILNIINAVMILSTDWQNSEINNSKTLWGILTIVLLGWIASLVFAVKAGKILKYTSQNENMIVDQENISNNIIDDSIKDLILE